MTNLNSFSTLQTLEMFKENHPDLNSIEKILDYSEESFITTFTDKEPFNGDIRKARQAYRAAQRIQEQITLLWANLKDIGSPVFKEALFNNIPQSFIDYFNSIPAYNRLFGNLDFIESDHSRSIFGPAAYFVDLLRFIDKNIIKKNKNSIPNGHELEKRQPRLFRLPLDKENTFNLVPYIDLVNEVLEDIVRKLDRSPYQVLEEAKFPMQLPFHLPLEEIRLYLKQLKISLEEIYRLFSLVGKEAFTGLQPKEDESGDKLNSDQSKQLFETIQKQGILDFRGGLTDAFQPDDPEFNLILSDFVEYKDRVIERLREYRGLEIEIAREILTLSPREYQLIENEISSPEELKDFYGVKKADDLLAEGKDRLENVEVFIEKTGLTHKQLNELLFLDLSNEEINAGLSRLLFINNTGENQQYLKIEPNFENKLFPLDIIFANELNDHILSGNLNQQFIEKLKAHLKLSSQTTIEFSDDVKVLVDSKDRHWRIWDSQFHIRNSQQEIAKNITFVIRRQESQLIVYDEPYDRIENLTLKRLDRIYRFLKLSRKLGWTFAELDWALRTLQKTPVGEKVLRFDGVNDYVVIPNVHKDDPKAFQDTFTLEAWVQPTQAKINPIFTKGTPDGSFTQFLFYITPIGKLAFFSNIKQSIFREPQNSDILGNSIRLGEILISKDGGQTWVNEPELKPRNNLVSQDKGKTWFIERRGDLVTVDLKNIPNNDSDHNDYGLVLISDRSIPLNAFTHVAVSVNEEKKISVDRDNNPNNTTVEETYFQLKFYINGVLDSTWLLKQKLPVTDLPDVPEVEKDKVQIDINIGNNLCNEFFSGSITDVRLWHRSISEEDVASNRFKRLNGREEKLFAYWPLIESLDAQIQDYAVIKDEKKQQYHGILGNDSPYTLPIWVHGDLALDSFPAPVSIYAYHFNGVDEYVGGKVNQSLALINQASFLSTKLTIEGWIVIKAIEPGKIYPLLIKGDIEGNPDNRKIETKYKLWIDDNRKLIFWNSEIKKIVRSNQAIPVGEPTHFAFAVSGSLNVLLYINGIKEQEILIEPAIEPQIGIDDVEIDDCSILYLGRDFEDNYFKGSMQEVRIWNLPRTLSEIETNRHYQLTGNEQGLVGYWRLDKPNPHLSEAHDRTVNKNHLYPGGILELYQPQSETYNHPILPESFQSESKILTFGANQYPAIIQNEKRQGLGHFEQFTLQFWFKADEPGVSDRKQVLYTQGDRYTGLNIYLSKGKLLTYAWHEDYDGTPIDEPVSLEYSLIEAGKWYHLTFTYDETVEHELSSSLAEEKLTAFRKLDDKESGKTLDGKQKEFEELRGCINNLAQDPKAIKVWLDEPDEQWRIRDYYHGKTYLIRRNDTQLALYEKTPHPQNEVAYHLYVVPNGEQVKEGVSREDGFRLDQVGTADLGSLTPNIFTRFEDGLATVDSDCHFSGQITEFRLWQRVLSDHTINRLQHIPPELKYEDLICYLPMTEGFGRNVSDHKGPLYQTNENKGLGPMIPDQSPNVHNGSLSVGSDIPDWVKEVKDLPIFRDRVLKLNGKEQYLLLPYASDLNFIDHDFTLETWIRVDAFSTEDMPIVGSNSPKDADDDVAKNQGLYLLLTNRGQIRAGLYGDHVTSDIAIATKQWHHIAWRFEKATKTQTIYIDGKPQGSLSDSQSLQNDIPLYLGYRQVKQGYEPPAQSYFTGEIAELKVWSTAQTDAQIQATWNQELKGDEDNLEAYWIFDRDPRSLLVDRTNSAYRAPIELGSNSDLETKWSESTTPFRRQSLALQLNPEANQPIDYIDLSPCVLPEQGTIELWVQFCRSQDLILFDASTADRKPFLIAISHQWLYLCVTDDSGIETLAHIHLASFPEAFDSEWHHLVATWEFNQQTAETSIQIILDGFYKDCSRRQGNGKKPEFSSPCFGLRRNIERIDYPTQIPHTQYFPGKISQLRIWERVLTRPELQRFQNADLEGNEQGLSFCLVVVEEPVTTEDLLLYAPKTNQSNVEPLTTHLKDLVSGKTFCLSRLAIPDPHPHWVDIDTGIELDGEDDFIDLPHYYPTESGTIELWAQFSHDRNQVLLDASNDEPQGIQECQKYFRLEVRHGKLRFGIEDDSDLDCIIEINLDKEHSPDFFSQWHHIVVSWQFDEANQKVKAWLAIDGEFVHTSKPSCSQEWVKDYLKELFDPKRYGIKPILKSLYVGKLRGSYYPGKDGDRPRSFQGKIAQIRVWDSVRSQKDLQTLRDVPLQGTEGSLLVYLPLEEGQGTTLNNLKQPRFNRLPLRFLLHFLEKDYLAGMGLLHDFLAQTASLEIGADREPESKWVHLDRGVQLNGIEQFIEIPDYIPANNGTIEVWGQFPRYRDAVIFDASNNGENSFILKVEDGYLCYELHQAVAKFDLTYLPETFDRGWHHIAVTWHSNIESKKITINLHLDGQERSSTHIDISARPLQEMLRNLYIGIRRDRSNTPQKDLALSGTISQIRIWDRALCNDELKRWRYAELAGSETGLLVYLQIDEGSGIETEIRDRAQGDGAILKIGGSPTPEWYWQSPKLFHFQQDYIVLPKTKVLGINESDFTLEAWIKLDDLLEEQPILGIREPRNPQLLDREQLVLTVNLEGRVLVRMCGKTLVADRIQLSPHRWYHIVCQYQASDRKLSLSILQSDRADCQYDRQCDRFTATIYTRGIEYSHQLPDKVESYNAHRRLYIGFWRSWNDTSKTWDEKCFRGFIDEVRIWKGIKNSNQIQENRDRRLRGDESGLVAYWSLTDEHHRTLYAIGIQRHQSRLPHQVKAIAPVHDLASEQPPIYAPRSAPQLDGYNDYVALGQTFLTNERTIEFWFRAQQWHHLAAIYEESPTPTLFYDGVPISHPLPEELDYQLRDFLFNLERNTLPQWSNQFFYGQIAELRLWDCPRTPTEIQANFKRRLTGRETHLWAYYPLNEGEEIDLYDESETLASAEWIVGLENTAQKWQKLPPPIEEPIAISGLKTQPISALYLDGRDDFITLGNIADLELHHDFTVEAWVKIDESAKGKTIAVLGSKALSNIDRSQSILCLGIKDKRPYLSFGSTTDFLHPNWNLDQEWHHLTWRYEAKSKTMSILVDGSQVGEKTEQPAFTGAGEARIGYCQEWDESCQMFKPHYFAGGIGEIRIWRSVRSIKEEICAYYKRRLPGTGEILQHLVAYWIFDDCNHTVIPSQVAVDGNSYQLAIHSDKDRGQPIWNQIKDRPILLNPLPQKALHLDGKQQYLATNELLLPSNEFTLEAWVKVENLNQPRSIFWWSNRDRKFEVCISEAGQVQFLNPNGETLVKTGDDSRISEGSFYHIAVTVQPQDNELEVVTVWINGKDEGSDRVPVPTPLDNPQDSIFQVGRGNPNHSATYFKGLIQEIRIWNKAKTEKELKDSLYYPVKLEPTPDHLLAYWPLNKIREDRTGIYTNNLVKNSPDLRLGGLIASRKPNAGEATQFLDARRPVLTLPVSKDTLHQLPILPFKQQYHPDRSQRTVEVWFSCENPFLADRQIVYEEASKANQLTIYVQSGQICYQIERLDDGFVSTIKTDRIQAGRWHHVALVLDGREEISDNAIYALLDGRVIDTQPAFQLSGKPEYALVGGLKFALSPTDASSSIIESNNSLVGQIKEVRVWEAAHSPQEIQAKLQQQLQTNQFELSPEEQQLLLLCWETHALPKSIVSGMKLLPLTEAKISNPQIPLLDLAHLLQLKNEYQQSVERLCSLWAEVKHIGIADRRTLFDDIFNPGGTSRPLDKLDVNLEKIGFSNSSFLKMSSADQYWSYGQRIRWQVNSTETSQRQVRTRLMSALRVSSPDLDLMVRAISSEVDTVILDGSYLSQLYRLKLLATILQLSIEDVIKLLNLLQQEYQDAPAPLNDLAHFTIQDTIKLKTRVDWMRETAIDLSEYDFLVNDKEDKRVSVPYKDADVFDMAVALLNQCREHLLSPEGLAKEGIVSDAASPEVYRKLKDDNNIEEITLRLPSGNNNPDTIVKLGVVQPDFLGFNTLSSDNYLELIARNSNWLAEFQGLINLTDTDDPGKDWIDQLGRVTIKELLLFNIDGSFKKELDQLPLKPSDRELQEIREKFQSHFPQKYLLSQKIGIQTRWRVKDGEEQPIYSIQLTNDDLLNFYESARYIKSLLFTVPLGLRKQLDITTVRELFKQKGYQLSPNSILEQEWLIVDNVQQISYLIRNNVRENQLNVLDIQAPEQLSLKKLQVAYQHVTPRSSDEKLLQVREKLINQQQRQSNVIPYLTNQLILRRDGLLGTILTPLADLLGTNPDRLKLIVESTKSNGIQGKTYGQGQLFAQKFLQEINKVAIAEDKNKALLESPDLYNDLKQWSKILFLLSQFALSDFEISVLLKQPGVFGLKVLNLLKPSLFDLANLYTFVKLKTDLRNPTDPSDRSDELVRILQKEQGLTISSLTNWRDDELNKLRENLKIETGSLAMLDLDRLSQAFRLSRKLGTNAQYLVDLAIETSGLKAFDPIKSADPCYEFYQRHAEVLFNLMRARYNTEQWPLVYKPIHDRLAVLKRDGLTGFVMEELSDRIQNRKNPDLLYEYLLIDVQTGSEVDTSRIVQGIAGLQLYIQRCLMNLEAGIKPETVPLKEWEWMKNYRVWEANRKVFLYPENYIEPELRDTKTPLFKQLEEDLQQSDVTKHTVAEAYTRYLDKFAEVSNLTIVGSYLDTKTLQSTFALKFNGQNFIEVSSIKEIATLIPKEFTIELWLKPSIVSSSFGIASAYNWDKNQQGWILETDGSEVKFYLATQDSQGFKTVQARINPKQWYHVAVTYDGNKLTMYSYGQESSSVNLSGNIDYPLTFPSEEQDKLKFVMGARKDLDFDTRFLGEMREFRIWNQARERELIQATMFEKIPVDKHRQNQKFPLVHYWRMDEAKNNKIEDLGKGKKSLSLKDAISLETAPSTMSSYSNDNEKILYLVGRNESTQEYYFRTLINNTDWQPWNKIDLSINAKFVSPVFAFNKLFIFWAEIVESVRSEDRKWVTNNNEGKPIDQVGDEIVIQTRPNPPNTKFKLSSGVELTLEKATVDDKDGGTIRGTVGGGKLTYVFSDKHNVIQQVNVKVKKPVIKYSYYNFSEVWTQPQTYKELDKELNDWEQLDPKWQRVYVQRWRESQLGRPIEQAPKLLNNVLVAQLGKNSFIEKRLPFFSMDKLTLSFWLRVNNLKTKDNNLQQPPSHTFTLISYDGDQLAMTVSSEWTKIDEKAEIMTAVQEGETAVSRIGDIVEAIKNFHNNPTDINRKALNDINGTLSNTQKPKLERAYNAISTPNGASAKKLAEETIKTIDSVVEAVTKLDPPRVPVSQSLSLEQTKHLAKAVAKVVDFAFEIAKNAKNVAGLPNSELAEAEQHKDNAQTYANMSDSATDIDEANEKANDTIQETIECLKKVSDFAKAAQEKEEQEPKWERNELKLQIKLGSDTKELFTQKVDDTNWKHIALVIAFLPDAPTKYSVTRYIFDCTNPANNQGHDFDQGLTQEFLASNLEQGEILSIGKADNPSSKSEEEGQYQPQMSEFRLWYFLQQKIDIDKERFDRKSGTETELKVYFPLDRQESNQSQLILVNSDLSLHQVFPPLVPAEKRERILLMYGNTINTLRNNLKDTGYSYTLEAKEIDKECNSLVLREPKQIGATIDISDENVPSKILPEFYSNENAIISLDRFLPVDRLAVLKSNPGSTKGLPIGYPPPNIRESIDRWNESYSTDNTPDNFILNNPSQIKIIESYILDVHNQPGWSILDIGDEIFLVKISVKGICPKTAEERIESNELNKPNLEQNIKLWFGADLQIQTVNFDALSFEFIRLNTFAVHTLSERLFGDSIDGLLSIESQNTEEPNFENLANKNLSGKIIAPKFKPRSTIIDNRIDFEGAYGLYYQEIFFQIPFLIANQLNANQKFAEAQQWYHYIFNPNAQEDKRNTQQDSENQAKGKDRYWRYRPFRNLNLETLSEILTNADALNKYREDPFDPHTIARLRLNTYQKAVAMKYIDNLLDWGDYLFRQDTRESINEAIPLYVLAFNLLGPRPKAKPERKLESMGTYQDIQADLQGNNISELPDFLIPSGDRNLNDKVEIPFDPNRSVITRFIVPENAQFIGYWDRVEDRLYKIRHSLNIDGVFRALDLFQPPIDPAVLVRAVAGGGLAGGISAALASLNMPVPHYRYNFMLEKAKEMNRQAIELGGVLLQALEKKDAEELLLLQHTHELNIMNRMTEVKHLQKQEAETNLESLKASLQNAQDRFKHYENLIDEGISTKELVQIGLMGTASILRLTQVFPLQGTASVLRALPTITVGGSGFGGSPHAVVGFGSEQLAGALSETAGSLQTLAGVADEAAQIVSLFANYERREQDWQLQKTIAEHDIAQIEQQIAATAIQINIVSRELQIHELTIAQQKEVGDFYRNKFTNKELYNWMTSRLSGLYFQTYKLAFDLAKKAEKAYQYEYGTNDTYIDFGHWDSRRKGLLAGEGLRLDLARLEKAALDQHGRYLEVTTNISLSRLDPIALVQLKRDGRCQFGLSELLFDRDFPGHYFRTIKSVSISIPAVISPYQTFKATLTQTSNKTLLAPDIEGVRYLMGDGDQSPTTIRADYRANQQIAISTGVEDSGMFELNFGDGRYLPFEGTGAISTWLLEVPKITNPIDFDSLTDVIIHVRYTSKADGGKFKQEVMQLENFKKYEGVRLLYVAQDFPDEWQALQDNNFEKPQNLPIASDVFALNGSVDIDRFDPLQNYTITTDGKLEEAQFGVEYGNNSITISFQGSLKKEQVENLIILLSYTGKLKT